MTGPVHPTTRCEILISEASGEWLVAVREDGMEDVRSFVREDYALSYAEGQKMRLRLAKVDRILPQPDAV